MESILYILYIILKLEKSESNTLTGVRIEAETKKLWPFEDNHTKLSENFAAAKSVCETTCKHTCATSQFKFHFHTMRITLRNQPFLAKWTLLTFEIHLCNLRYLRPTQLDFFSRYFM